MSDTRRKDHRREWQLARKLKRLAAVALLVTLTACATTGMHNPNGGYTPACGDTLPGLIGDDC